jgi:hypothetical protein
MLSPSETGTTLGATPGTCREPGDRPLARVPGTGGGAQRKQSQATGRPGAARRARPLHLIHGGALSIAARQERLLPGPARPNASRDDPGHGPGAQARSSSGHTATRGSKRGSRRAHTRGSDEHPRPPFLHDLIRAQA